MLRRGVFLLGSLSLLRSVRGSDGSFGPAGTSSADLLVRSREELGLSPTGARSWQSSSEARSVRRLQKRLSKWQGDMGQLFERSVMLDAERTLIRGKAAMVFESARMPDTREAAAGVLALTKPRIIRNSTPAPTEPPMQQEEAWKHLLFAIADLVLGRLVMKMVSDASRPKTEWASVGRRPSRNGVEGKGVIGCDEAKAELVEAVQTVVDADKASVLGARPPAGVLLYGPPGTGKTLLAATVAQEAGLPFVSISGSSFNRMYVGSGTALVRSVFAKARVEARRAYFRNVRRTRRGRSRPPCAAIIHIDEIDAVGRRRSGREEAGGALRDSDATLNQLLVEMDGSHGKGVGGMHAGDSRGGPLRRWWRRLFPRGLGLWWSPEPTLLVIGSTNRAKLLDPALLRPGRFDRNVAMPLPDRRGREDLFVHYLAKIRVDTQNATRGLLDDDEVASLHSTSPGILIRRRAARFETAAQQKNEAELQEAVRRQLARALADGSPGLSGADIAAVVNEAALQAATANRTGVTLQDMEHALDKQSYGRERSRLLSPEDKWRVAVHEAGHTVAAWFQPGADPVRKVSVMPRGDFLGATFFVPGGQWGAGNDTQAAQPLENFFDEVNPTVAKQETRMVLALAGRAAEALVIGDIALGAEDDIHKATRMAYQMVAQSGQSKVLGPMTIDDRSAEKTREAADEETRRLLLDADQKVKRLLWKHQDAVRRVAEALVKHETLTAADITSLIGPHTEERRVPTPKADLRELLEA